MLNLNNIAFDVILKLPCKGEELMCEHFDLIACLLICQLFKYLWYDKLAVLVENIVL